MYKNKFAEITILAFSFIFIWLYFFFGYEGHYGWDDMEYAQIAYQWATGNFSLSDNHFTYRHPVIILTGLCYKIFGLNDFASSLPAILLSMFIIFLVYLVLIKNDTRIIITAIITTLLMPFFIMYSHKLMGDMYVATGIFGSFVSYYLYKFRYKKYSFLFALLFSLLLIFAFLTKEVVVLILPVLLILFFNDILKKQHIGFWLWTFAFVLIFVVFYHLLLWKITGSPWSRYIAIEQNAYLNPCSYELFPFISTLKRIGYEFWNELILKGLFFIIIFIISYFFKRFKNIFSHKPESFWIIVSVLALISANFMTKSHKAYSPMCLDMRHYLYLIPIISVAAAPNIVRFFYTASRNWIIFIFTIIVSIIYFLQMSKPAENVFAFTVAVVFLVVIIRIYKSAWKIKISTFFWIVFLFAWLIFPVYQMMFNRQNTFKEIKPFIKRHFKTNEKTIVITDPILKRIADYYNAWDSTNVRFISDRSSLIPYYEEAKNYLVYRNGLTWWYLEKKHPEPMLLWYLVEPNIKLIDSINGNELYKVVSPQKIYRPTNFLSFFCDMENVATVFSINKNFIDSTKVFSGKYSYRIIPKNFSPTLILPFQRFVTDKTVKFEVEIASKVLCYTPNNTNLVISVVDSLNNTIFWLGKPIKELIKNSPDWQEVSFKASYLPNKRKEYLLKVYLWNDDNSEIFIDNLVVNILVIEHL